MHGPINVKSPNNTSKWQMGFNSAIKGLTRCGCCDATTTSRILGVGGKALRLGVSERGSTQGPILRAHLPCVSTNGPDPQNLIKQKGVNTYGEWFGASNAIGQPVTARPLYPVVIMSSMLWHSCTDFLAGQEIAHALPNSKTHYSDHVSLPLNHIINQFNITSLKHSLLILSHKFRLDTKVDYYIHGVHITLWMYESH
jgi:hypothetical protein